MLVIASIPRLPQSHPVSGVEREQVCCAMFTSSCFELLLSVGPAAPLWIDAKPWASAVRMIVMGESDGTVIIVGAGIFGVTAAIEPAEPFLPPASPGGRPAAHRTTDARFNGWRSGETRWRSFLTYSARSRISCISSRSRRIGLPRMLLEPSAASIKPGKSSTATA